MLGLSEPGELTDDCMRSILLRRSACQIVRDGTLMGFLCMPSHKRRVLMRIFAAFAGHELGLVVSVDRGLRCCGYAFERAACDYTCLILTSIPDLGSLAVQIRLMRAYVVPEHVFRSR